MRWTIVAPFIKQGDKGTWLGAFVPGTRHRFDTVAADHSHDRSRSRTDAAGWADHFRHAWRGLRVASARPDGGLITCFPQLAVAAGLLSHLNWRRVPIIAWTFNLGTLPGGWKRRLSGFALRRVDAIIVHSVVEIEECASCFGIARDKFIFVPLQRAIREPEVEEDVASPYAIALGSANRDYRLLFDVLRTDPVRTVVVAGAHAVRGLDIPDCVELRSGLSLDECHRLLQAARISLIPVDNATTASGQVTLLDSMGMGRATVVTRCPGSTDYVIDGATALLVDAGDRAALATAIRRLWQDTAYREQMGRQGREHVIRRFSDQAIGRVMGEICDAVEDHRPLSSIKPQ